MKMSRELGRENFSTWRKSCPIALHPP